MLTDENHINDELLVSYLLDEAPAQIREQVERWISANASNKRYFDHFRLIWETSRSLVIPETVNEDEAWKRFLQRTEQPQQKTAIVRRLDKPFSLMRVAAILLISIGAMTLSYFLWDRLSTSETTFASAGESREEILPDRSVVTMNKHSSISYAGRLNGKSRKIRLKGEAFFKVTPDKTKPFEVEVSDVTVTVLGTSFNVKNLNGHTEVVVETGIVKVTRNGKTVILAPGEKVVIGQDDTAMAKQQTTDKLYNYYRSKEFVCDDTPLWKLVETLNEAYDAHIVIERKELRNLPITTTFYNQSLDNVLAVIAETFNISVERRGNEIRLK